ncbi:MAG: leucine-rich repeat protein [Oscillospiraceae bacterium]|nr:leucine-rich repeat protein [Oscillospiraceae bacterium]
MKTAEKRLLALLLVLVMVAGFVPVTARAEGASIVAQGTCGDQGDNVTWALTDDGVLTISGNGAMANYGSQATNCAPWIEYKDQITKVVFEEGVTYIGQRSLFRNTSNSLNSIVDVTIPESVTNIGANNFRNLASLTTVYYGGSPDRWGLLMTNIGSNNDLLSTVTIICAKANAPIENITISGSYKTFYNLNQAFDASGIIVKAYATDGLELDVTASAVFSGFDSSTVGEKEITVSYTKDEVTYTAAFTITVVDGGVINGGTCGANGNNVTWILSQSGTLTISGTGAMADYTYDARGPWHGNRAEIKSVVIENGVTSIGAYAFGALNTSMEPYDALTSVSIGNTVTKVGEGAFRTSNITEIVTPSSVTEFGTDAFANMGQLQKVTINGNALGQNMFGFCNALTEIKLNGQVVTIPNSFINYCDAIETITLPSTVKTIEQGAFAFNTALKTINLPSGLTSIGANAFYGCTALSINAVLPETLTTLGSSAFKSTAIKKAEIPAGIKTIEGSTFQGCGALTTVKLNEGLEVIKTDAFASCISLASISFPSTLTTIEDYRAFQNCLDLTEVTLPKNLTYLGHSAFSGCAGLKTVTIYDKLATIGNQAFKGCTALETVNFHGTEEQWQAIEIRSDNDPLTAATVNFIVPAPVSIEISGQYKTKYKIGEDFDPSGIKVTAQISDGTTQDVTADATFSGFDSTAPGTKTITVTYGALTATFTVTVEEPAPDITVKLTILGDTHHDMSEGNHGLWLGGLETWLPETEYTISSDAVVYDLLSQAFAADDSLTMFARYTEQYSSYYIYAVQKGDVTMTEKDNCANAGWMVAVNGVHVQVGVSLMTLKNGDSVILHWCDDYVADESEGARQEFAARKPAVKAEGDKKTGKIKLTITPVPGAVKYKIYVAGKAEGPFTLAAETEEETYTYNGNAGTRYFFKVVAVNGSGVESAESAAVSIIRLPGQVTGLKAKSTKKKEVTLTWKKVTGAKKYFIYMSKNGKTGWKKIGTATKTKFVYKKGTPGKKLYFKVQAVTANGKKGEFSKVVSVKVKK